MTRRARSTLVAVAGVLIVGGSGAGAIPLGAESLAVSLAASASAHAYRNVPLAALLRSRSVHGSIAGRPYTYAWSAAGWDRHTVLFLGKTSCRSLTATMGYVAPKQAQGAATVATLVVLQRSGSTSVNVNSGTVGRLRARLTGAAFELVLENAPGTAYGNGVARCSTKNGRP
jgi:hypothetical protein